MPVAEGHQISQEQFDIVLIIQTVNYTDKSCVLMLRSDTDLCFSKSSVTLLCKTPNASNRNYLKQLHSCLWGQRAEEQEMKTGCWKTQGYWKTNGDTVIAEVAKTLRSSSEKKGVKDKLLFPRSQSPFDTELSINSENVAMELQLILEYF